MDTDMEEIMARAGELGRLIQGTDIYKSFIRLSESLHADEEAAKMLDDYTRYLKGIKERQERGDIVEKFEIEHARNLADEAYEHEVVRKYLDAQKEYLELLYRIQREINDVE